MIGRLLPSSPGVWLSAVDASVGCCFGIVTMFHWFQSETTGGEACGVVHRATAPVT